MRRKILIVLGILIAGSLTAYSTAIGVTVWLLIRDLPSGNWTFHGVL